MNQENDQNTEKNEQSSNETVSVSLAAKEMMQVKRPRPGSIIILAPPGTTLLSGSSEDGLRLELHQGSRE